MVVEPRHQVFVSSTYLDLVEERRQVMQALLELDCIPAGMELFPASDDDSWSLIRQVIDASDYYVVIVGGRYGSVNQDTGISFTRMEYDYAVEQGKPVMGFLHGHPDELPLTRNEPTESGRAALEEFRLLVRQRQCRFWETPAELGALVGRSLVHQRRTHPMPGWIRASDLQQTAGESLLRRRSELKNLDDLFADATRIDIAATCGVGLINRSRGLLERRLRKGAQVRVILLDKSRDYAIETWDKLSSAPQRLSQVDLESGLLQFRSLQELDVTTGQCEVRVLDTLLPYSMVRVDSPSGSVIQLEHYGYRTAPEDRMNLVVTPQGQPHWFEFLTEQFTDAWNSSTASGSNF